MKKKFSISAALCIVMLLTAFTFTGCGSDEPTADCYNGNFVGQKDSNGVLAFKGIPYAKAPTGELRWKAPEPVEESDETIEAKEFGKSSIQYEWHSEAGSYNEIGEDCLTLNVWTADLETQNKPVMFYIHGGGFAWGGSSDPLYDGGYIVKEHEDVVVVSCNYRLGLMGLVDFSKVPGGEAFPDSTYLSVLDIIQALEWVQQNAAAFGGDPGNVTVFGESAGGAYVTLLMACEKAEGLFQHAVAQSGSANLTFSQKDFDECGLTDALLAKTGAKNMDDLMAIPEKDLIKIYTEYDESGLCLNDLANMPARGNDLIPADPYKAIASGVNKDVDFMTGTNADEWRYWVNEMGEVEMSEMTEEERQGNMEIYTEAVAQAKYDDAMAAATAKEKSDIKAFMNIVDEKETVWKNTELGNETAFRQPSILAAYSHAKAGGNTYMYYFGKKSDNFDFIGACHASEVAYVFNNTDETIFSGTVDETLADNMCAAWVNLAKTGDPSTDAAEWTAYTTDGRETMVIGDDCSMTMQSDPLKEQRKLTEALVKYYLK